MKVGVMSSLILWLDFLLLHITSSPKKLLVYSKCGGNYVF